MHRISYSDLDLGDLVLFENLSASRSMLKSCLVCGRVKKIEAQRFTLVNTVYYNGDLSDEVDYYYPRVKEDKLWQIPVNFKTDDFAPRGPWLKEKLGEDQLSKGDLVLVKYESGRELEVYFGFINRLCHDQILIRNYLANLREPSLPGRNELLILGEVEEKYSFLVLKEASALKRYFSFNLDYGSEFPN